MANERMLVGETEYRGPQTNLLDLCTCRKFCNIFRLGIRGKNLMQTLRNAISKQLSKYLRSKWMLESNRIAISLCTTYLTIIQNVLLQYINTVWHDALIFYNKVICSTAMYQKNLAFVFCIFLSFSNRSRSMKNYVSLEWDFEFHCTNDYSSSKLDTYHSFSFIANIMKSFYNSKN